MEWISAYYQQKEQLHDVLVLYELQRLQAKSIYLTEKSVSDIIALSPRTKLIHPTKINIARSIINLQIRSVIARLIDEGVPRVFKVLENKLIRKENLEKKWGLCFALLTMICFLAEKVHDSLEGYRLFLKDNHYHEPQNPHPLMHYAQELEKHVIRACIRQFHAFFKSGALHSGKRGIKLNPIQDTSSDYSSMGQASVELVNSIREFIDQNGMYLSQKRLTHDLQQKSQETLCAFETKNLHLLRPATITTTSIVVVAQKMCKANLLLAGFYLSANIELSICIYCLAIEGRLSSQIQWFVRD